MRSALQKLQPHLASDLAEYTERENTVHDISSVVWMDGFGSCGPHIVSGAGRARVFLTSQSIPTANARDMCHPDSN